MRNRGDRNARRCPDVDVHRVVVSRGRGADRGRAPELASNMGRLVAQHVKADAMGGVGQDLRLEQHGEPGLWGDERSVGLGGALQRAPC